VPKSGLDMRVSLRQLGWILLVLCPRALLGSEPGSAVLHAQGGVYVNGNEVGASTVVFPGDLIETRPGFVANLDAEGSAVLVQTESIVKFEKNFLTLEHGSVSVGTSTAMAVHIKCLKVEPVSSERTQYDVTDRTGNVLVVAHKQDVKITQAGGLRKAASEKDSATSSATVHEGEQASREESKACGAAAPPEGPTQGVNPKWIEIGAAAGGGVLVLCLLLCRGSGSSSVSPSQP